MTRVNAQYSRLTIQYSLLIKHLYFLLCRVVETNFSIFLGSKVCILKRTTGILYSLTQES